MKSEWSRITLTMIGLAIVISSLFTGCTQPSTTELTPIATSTPLPTVTFTAAPVHLPKQRITAPQVSPADRAALIAANGAFAFDLYHALRKENGNQFYSPYSISLALALAYAGARGETQQQMADALHFTLPPERLNPAFNALDLELSSRAADKSGKGFRLDIANAIWGEVDRQFLQEYLDTLAQNYGADLNQLDFKSDPEAARVTINKRISEQTGDKIQDLVPPDFINPKTRLILTNAIYFNAAWQHPFNESRTRDDTFHLLDGSSITVPLMHQRDVFDYSQGQGYQAVKLPYGEGNMSMVIVLPEAGRFSVVEDSLDAARVQALVAGMTPEEVDLIFPKFKVESLFLLGRTLDQLGMPNAFAPDTADFSGMDGMRDLYIGEVIHNAFISVDEAGTEAAAATAVVMPPGAAAPGTPPPVIEFKADRPFVFLIRDDATGAIIFVGRVVNPSE